MANRNLRLAKNASGQYYVDDTCIDCDRCRQIAPDIFGRDDESGKSFVIEQPNSLQLDDAEEAFNFCPTDSIGRDGDA